MTYEFPLSDEAKSFIESAEILAEPWRERIAVLEADRDSWRRVAERLESGIQAVRELHVHDGSDLIGGETCCRECGVGLPCPTLAASEAGPHQPQPPKVEIVSVVDTYSNLATGETVSDCWPRSDRP